MLENYWTLEQWCHGEKISMLRFSDDIAETEKDLKNILVNMGRVMGQYQPKINKESKEISIQ